MAMEPYAKEQRNVIPYKEHSHGTKSWLMEAMMLYVAEEMAIAYRARLVMIGHTEMSVGAEPISLSKLNDCRWINL
jgi:hypothetical protein